MGILKASNFLYFLRHQSNHGMGLYIKSLLFAFLNISIIHGKNLCPSSHCGSGNVTVHYPFKFEDEAPSIINCAYFNLRCNKTESRTIINLPHAGDFYVQKIYYPQKLIQLYDPANCLITRLFDLSLEASPFKTVYKDYTLYVCPPDIEMHPILCLSNSTNITIAVREPFMDDQRCQAIRSGQLPVYHDDIFFYLTWDSDDCVNCNENGGLGSKVIARLGALALTLPGLIIMSLCCCSVFCFHVVKIIKFRYGGDSGTEAAAETEAVPPSSMINPGLDESKIVGCTELVVVSESNEGMVLSANSKTCSICLENYSEKETISVISKCGHCFHANCIRQWLGKAATCPVCRTSLYDVV